MNSEFYVSLSHFVPMQPGNLGLGMHDTVQTDILHIVDIL